MWFRKRFKFDEATIEWLVGEVAVIKQQIAELEAGLSTHTRWINGLRGLVNKKLAPDSENAPALDSKAREFYESTVEYGEMNKALNKEDS